MIYINFKPSTELVLTTSKGLDVVYEKYIRIITRQTFTNEQIEEFLKKMISGLFNTVAIGVLTTQKSFSITFENQLNPELLPAIYYRIPILEKYRTNFEHLLYINLLLHFEQPQTNENISIQIDKNGNIAISPQQKK